MNSITYQNKVEVFATPKQLLKRANRLLQKPGLQIQIKLEKGLKVYPKINLQ